MNSAAIAYLHLGEAFNFVGQVTVYIITTRYALPTESCDNYKLLHNVLGGELTTYLRTVQFDPSLLFAKILLSFALHLFKRHSIYFKFFFGTI